jgi:hypothetical protein
VCPIEEFIGEASGRNIHRCLCALDLRFACCHLLIDIERPIPKAPVEAVDGRVLRRWQEVQDNRYGIEILCDDIIGSSQEQVQERENTFDAAVRQHDRSTQGGCPHVDRPCVEVAK